jgi:hypothetical protein
MLRPARLVALLLPLVAICSTPTFAEIREQAVVDLSFDEADGPAKDAATAGSVDDVGTLAGGAERVPSPFWNHRDGRAVLLDSAKSQHVAIPDGADVDRPDGVSASLFYVNLLPADAAPYHGLFAKRDAAAPSLTNYGINYSPKSDFLQLYVNTGSGYKVVRFGVKRDLGFRRLGHLTATWEIADAPGTDADTDRDDVRIRLFVNGEPATPSASTNGFVEGHDGWIADVDVAGLLNDVPLTIGSTNATSEFASGVVDEFLLFPKALSPDEAATLFLEVAGESGPELAQQEAAPPAAAPLPEITALSQHVLQSGVRTRLTITGKNLAGGRLLVPGLELEQQAVKGSNAGRLIVDVTPSGNATGRYPLRLVTAEAASNVQPISIDALPVVEATTATAESPAAALPLALHGTLAGPQSLQVHVAGKAGQTLIADLEARRLGARFDPVVEIKSPRGTPLAIEWARIERQGDTRAVATLPADGVYVVEVHDLTYKAPGRNPVVLRLATDDVAVPADAAAAPRQATFVDEQSADAGMPQEVDARFPRAAHVPLVVRGTVAVPGEEDRYVLKVTPGRTLALAVAGRAIDSPIDAVLAVHAHPAGNLLARSEDNGADRDPRLTYKVPANVQQIAVAVSDLFGGGGTFHAYELHVVPAGQPNFDLALLDRTLRLPRSGNAVVQLRVDRKGYDGPIRLRVEGDDSIALQPDVIPAGVGGTTFVTLERTGDAPDGTTLLHVVGESESLDPPLLRTATVAAAGNDFYVAASELALPVTTIPAAAMTVALAELPSAFFKGAVVSPSVTIAATGDLAAEPVRLTLLTNEPPRPVDPKDANKGNLPLIRSETGQVSRGDGTAGPLRILVPLDVAAKEVDAVVKAEIVRHAYSNAVLATAYSTPFRLPVSPAVQVTVDAATLKFTDGAPNEIRGEVKRTAGFDAELTIRADGLPRGFTTNVVTLPPGESTFVLTATPPATPPAAPATPPEPKLHVRLGDDRPLVAPVKLPITFES